MKSLISWSGGKDSCLALYKSIKRKLNVKLLLTSLDEKGSKIRSHGISKDLMFHQSQCLGIKIKFIKSSWENYEKNFIKELKLAKKNNFNLGVFGDIDLIEHKNWEEKVCEIAGISAHLPLWKESREKLVREFLYKGFKARVVCVDNRFLNNDYVGCEFDKYFISNLPKNVDICGENGEFHTFVYDGPIFKKPVFWKSLGKKAFISPAKYGSQKYFFDLLDIQE
tara:strand:+ start:303 stop:974 length:672 start_codon:yes stop_codon:yes gene_type:complete